LLIDSCQRFGKSLPALIQLSQDFLLFRLKHVSDILTAEAAPRPPAPHPPSHFGYYSLILELTQEAGSEDPEASER
jgi:hypothetical protein